MKMSVLRNAAPYSPVDTDRRFGAAYCLYRQIDSPDDGGNKSLIIQFVPQKKTTTTSVLQKSSG
jgi:hypothetical protein